MKTLPGVKLGKTEDMNTYIITHFSLNDPPFFRLDFNGEQFKFELEIDCYAFLHGWQEVYRGMIEVNTYPLREWIDLYYEDISPEELAKDMEVEIAVAKGILHYLKKEEFVSSPTYNDHDRYKVLHK